MGRRNWIAILVLGIVAIGGVFAVRLRERSSGQPAAVSAQPVNTPSPSASLAGTPEVAPSVPIDEHLRATIVQSFKAAVEANHARFREMATSRWTKVTQGGDAGQRSMLSSKDVADFRRNLQALVASVDHGLSVFAEAEARDISLSGVGDNALESDPEAWRLFRRYWAASEQYHGILEVNWEEYYEFGVEAPVDQAKPWQLEAMRAQAEMNAAQKDLEKLTAQTQ